MRQEVSDEEKAVRKRFADKILTLHSKVDIYLPYIRYPCFREDGTKDFERSIFSFSIHDDGCFLGKEFIGIQDADMIYLKSFSSVDDTYRYVNELFEKFCGILGYEDFSKVLKTVLTQGFFRVIL